VYRTVKVRRSSSAGSASVKMAAMMSREFGRLSVSLSRLIRAMARSANWTARCCMAASRSSSLVPK